MNIVAVRLRRNAWKVKTHTAISFICLLLLCIPKNESAFPLVCTILKYVQIPCCLYGIYVFLMNNTYKKRWLRPMWWLLICVCVCTIVQQPQYTVSVCIYSVQIFCVVVLSDYLLSKSIVGGLKCIAIIWALFMFFQGISLITHCFGTTQSSNISIANNYFFGIRNDINQYLIYTIAFVWYAVHISRFSRIVAIVTTAICIYFVIVESVSTAIVGLAIFALVLLLEKVLKSEKVWRALFVFLGICIAVFIIGQKTQFFTWLIQEILNKDITLTGRTVIWIQAIEQMTGDHWLFGYGYNPDFNFQFGMLEFNHPHNQYLQMLYNFGIGGLVLYIIMIYKMIKQIKHIVNGSIKKTHIATLAATLIMCIVSRNFFYSTAPIYYVLCAYLPSVGATDS